MNRRPSDIDARLSAWLEEGPTSGPEEVLSRTFARARSTRQDRARLHRLTQPTRSYAMNSMLKVAAVAALALAVGVTVLPRGPDLASAPAPSPSPSPSAIPLPPDPAQVAPGTYSGPLIEGSAARWTVTVPEGWEKVYEILWSDLDGLNDYTKVGGPGEVAFGWWQVANVFADPCHWKDSLADPPVGATADDLANAFAQQVGRAGSGPTDVTFGGYPAKRIDLSVPADLDVTTCDEGVYREFLGPGESLTPHADVDPSRPHMAGRIDVLYILDVDGTRLLMRTWHHPGSSPEDLAEMEAMLASIVIDPPAPASLRAGSLPAGTYSVAPFVPPDEWTLCMAPPQPGCVETASDDAITFTFTVPEGWEGAPFKSIWLADEMNAPPGGAGLSFSRGGSLYSDPCLSTSSPPTPDIPVGPSVDEFADALAEHPLLDVTTPVDVTLDGYAGRYLELRTPADISGCDPYLPWEPGLFSQPSRVWHLWILDVDGVRVVVTTTDYPGTAPDVQAELEGIVDSIRIHVAPTPAASPSPGLVAWGPVSPGQDWPAPVRAEPVGDPIIVPFVSGGIGPSGGYTDRSGDVENPDMPWIDIQRVSRRQGSGVTVDIAASAPPPMAGPNEPWIVYGLVLDTDFDGVPDVRYGMDRMRMVMPERPPDHIHVWRTDLHTGRTESGDQAGPVWLCDCLYPEADAGPVSDEMRADMEALGPDAFAYFYLREGMPPGSRFYAWASVIQDGRVLATDYAPDTGWLDGTP